MLKDQAVTEGDWYYLEASGVNDFSPFSVSSEEIPLPVTINRFDAILQDDAVEITWETQSEINNDYFVVERTSNLHDYETVARVEGTGNSTISRQYRAIDQEPLQGKSYYRLRQIDYDGLETIYGPVVVNYGIALTASLLIYPNPTNGQVINLMVEGYHANRKLSVVILDLQAKTVNTFNTFTNDQGGFYGTLHLPKKLGEWGISDKRC